ncbi:zinc finger CCCH domain-containing protein 4 [Iris pallida]|uniref:Zinc finger CCCH domain-containing protein 4 n=1 Tax=Iris pallida TaxID=29817 RepID=A0AAX6EXT1_IRIPA|nr:zinc finger CCCH domain-containing protein 4 [Iris pallida]
MAKEVDDASSSVVSVSESSHASAPASRPPLPVMALREKIVEKIQENRVTLIVGETGCGKSSQVPLFLLEENMQPILCTQPRRFAAVAIARTVAKARNCEVGGEVGYHIGHSNVSDRTSTRSKIVFKTAGVLLEQMRDKGVAALKYKVIILDEVHERSVESDLVLACVKQFMMKKKDIRVVLMSATADIARYRDFFKDLGRGERVEVIAIPSAPQHNVFQRKVMYLEQVAGILGIESKNSESLSSKYCSGMSSAADADMKPELHALIHKLIWHIHENESDIKKSVLVFLPTYFSLEQQWILLRPLSLIFEVHILHRSIDTDQALLAMRVSKSHRKVILATNIAESSVTIPGVAFIIDSCRSLQILWDPNRKRDTSELVWVSKSQAEQRKGRTGRTCDGEIYRLVTGMFYNSLSEYEYPAILRLSLTQQVLMVCCAESKAINDPKVLLQKVLDPPDHETVEEALNLLVHIHALEKPPTHRGRYEPTFYGRLLDNLPLSFDASVIALKFGEIGLFRDGVLVSILMDILPLPILQPFGHQILSAKYVDNYFEGDITSNIQSDKKETIFIGNLCAFQFWQRVFKDKHRLERLKQIINIDEPKISQSMISKLEEEWCLFHNLVQTSLHNVSEIYEDIINGMHRFRPDFFAANELPLYYEPCAFQHTCLLQSELVQNMDGLTLVQENSDFVGDTRKCLAAPYVTPYDFHAITIFEKLKTLIKEMRILYTEDASSSHGETVSDLPPQSMEDALCRYFVSGSCSRGNQCPFSHSLQAKRPTCKFFLTLQGCRNGASCYFSHAHDPSSALLTASSTCSPENEYATAYSFLQLLPTTADSCVFLLNDTNLSFTSRLSYVYAPSKIITTTPHAHSTELDALSNGAKVLWNVTNPYYSIIDTKGEDPIPWKNVCSVFWFPDIDADDANIQIRFIQTFFELLAIRILAETLYDLQVIITMNNIRFAQLQVERLARECFFNLARSFPFDESTFGKLSDECDIVRPMQVSAPITYVFDMHPPKDIQFGDYAAVLYKGLHSLDIIQ